MSQPEMKVGSNGRKYWYLNGELHREDGPAVECPDGTNWWYLNGELHREGGPAIECPDGTKEWYLNGELHREGGPAIEWPNGTKDWYLNGRKHSFEEYIDKLEKLGLQDCVIATLYNIG